MVKMICGVSGIFGRRDAVALYAGSLVATTGASTQEPGFFSTDSPKSGRIHIPYGWTLKWTVVPERGLSTLKSAR
jgi:hypothetical protein